MADEIDVLRALAHPVRWGILERLAAEPGICACSFTEFFSVSQPTISAHLKALRQAGLVTTQRRGTEIWYSLARDQLTPLAGRLSGIAGVPAVEDAVVEDAVVEDPSVEDPSVQVPAIRATVPYRAGTPVPGPAAPAQTRLADVVAPAMAAAARITGGGTGPGEPPLAQRASGGLAAAAAAAQAAAQAARRPSGDGAASAPPAMPQRSRGLADMAAMAQAAVPRGAGRRRRIPRRGARASVAAGSPED